VDSIEDPSSLKVRIKESKTDPFRLGVDVFVGRTGNELCPVAAVLAYMMKREPGPGPFFTFQDGKPLTRQRFVARVREALTLAGIDCLPYSGHSFRSRAATTASKCGISDASKCLEGGKAVPINSISRPQETSWQGCPGSW